MGKKLTRTSRAVIISHLRALWLRSKERAEALKRDAYTCQVCNVKQSKKKGQEQKVLVHHKEMIDWDDIVTLIQDRLLVHPDKLITMCPDCHKNIHHKMLITINKD